MNVPLPPVSGFYWYQIELDPPVRSNFVDITFGDEILYEHGQDGVFPITEIEVYEGIAIIYFSFNSIKKRYSKSLINI